MRWPSRLGDVEKVLFDGVVRPPLPCRRPRRRACRRKGAPACAAKVRSERIVEGIQRIPKALAEIIKAKGGLVPELQPAQRPAQAARQASA